MWWVFGKYKIFREVAHGGELKGGFLKVFMLLVKVVAPIAIFIVFLQGIKILDMLKSLISNIFN